MSLIEQREPASVGRLRPLLGTFVEVRASGPMCDLHAGVEAAYRAIERVQALMSFHTRDSDVTRINLAAAGTRVPVDPHTYRVLEFARQLGDVAGAFDIATAAVLVAGGLLPSHGRKRAVTVRQLASYRDLELLPANHVRWRRPGLIDLGGIAKGYAVDLAIAALQAHGATAAVVNAGGDLRSFGASIPVHVRAPDQPNVLIFAGRLNNGAFATSAAGAPTAAAGRALGSRARVITDVCASRSGTLVDPVQRRSVPWRTSVSVAAADCMTADALTKVVALAPNRAPALLERFGARALLTDGHHLCIAGPTDDRPSELAWPAVLDAARARVPRAIPKALRHSS